MKKTFNEARADVQRELAALGTLVIKALRLQEMVDWLTKALS